jgi:hypothetical protein
MEIQQENHNLYNYEVKSIVNEYNRKMNLNLCVTAIMTANNRKKIIDNYRRQIYNIGIQCFLS